MFQIKQYLKIAKLIAGDLIRSGNDVDDKALEQWLNASEENKAIYQNIKKDGWYAEHIEGLTQFNIEKGWNSIQPRINSRPRTIKMIPNLYKYVAAAVIVIGLVVTTFIFKDNLFNTPQDYTPIIVNNQIEPGTDKATLTLEDGQKVTLTKGTSYQTQNATSNGEEIVYKDGRRKNRDELVYNTLTIPRGGQFFVTLADGTKVWLNSESQLKYPVSFTDGESRQVELVYGEAYFEISHSTEHQGSDFKVYHDQQEVQVLGTEFNIKAYKDETNVYTTLIKGKVSVAVSGANQILAPNQQSNFNVSTNTLTVTMVDIYNETAWKEGVFSFEGKPLKAIMKTLSRWYDMEVVFQNPDLEGIKFIGVVGKEQQMESILTNIKNMGFINTFEIHDKTVILK
ncbi:MAG TPA: FecR domain-containing protein [Flavobacteriaceae bacterium]